MSESEGSSKPEAVRGEDAPDPQQTLLYEILAAVKTLQDRVADLEDAVAETVEGQEKLGRQLKDLKRSLVGRKQLKKLKKVLDQFEGFDVGPEDSEPEKVTDPLAVSIRTEGVDSHG